MYWWFALGQFPWGQFRSGRTVVEHLWTKCNTLIPEIFLFAQDTIDTAGFEFSSCIVRPCAKYFNVIMDFPTPKNITDVRSWFELVNQLSYAFSMAKKMTPFRQLLKHNVPFEWTTDLENLVRTLKKKPSSTRLNIGWKYLIAVNLLA